MFEDKFALPIEIEIRIDPDGSVLFADLSKDMLPVADALGDEQSRFCRVPDGEKQ